MIALGRDCAASRQMRVSTGSRCENTPAKRDSNRVNQIKRLHFTWPPRRRRRPAEAGLLRHLNEDARLFVDSAALFSAEQAAEKTWPQR